MFFNADNIQSSNIETLKLNLTTNQVLVKYAQTAKSYLYENVDLKAILDFMVGEIKSAGKFVNAYCKGNQYTTVGLVHYTLPSNFGWFSVVHNHFNAYPFSSQVQQ